VTNALAYNGVEIFTGAISFVLQQQLSQTKATLLWNEKGFFLLKRKKKSFKMKKRLN
jgi:hypothetical protein